MILSWSLGQLQEKLEFVAPWKVYLLVFHQWSVVTNGMTMVESMEVNVVLFSPHATHMNQCSMAVFSRPEHGDHFYGYAHQ